MEPQPQPRVLFIADAGPKVGGGHLMRCLTLAAALAQRGAACAFVDHPGAAAMLDAFAEPRMTRLAVGELDVHAARQVAADWAADAVVVDHYGVACAQEQALQAPGRLMAVIDDLADRPHDCDLLLDPGLGRDASSYAGLIPTRATALTGPDYALVRPEFAALRPASLERRRQGAPVQRLLIALGLTDLEAITARVVEAVIPVADGLELDVVVGRGAASLPALAALSGDNPRLQVYVETTGMGALMAAADLAVGAGGSSTWERACLGLPSLNLVLADNQRGLAVELERRGASVLLEASNSRLGERLRAEVAALRVDGSRREALSEASARLCDGRGAERAAEALLGRIGGLDLEAGGGKAP